MFTCGPTLLVPSGGLTPIVPPGGGITTAQMLGLDIAFQSQPFLIAATSSTLNMDSAFHAVPMTVS